MMRKGLLRKVNILILICLVMAGCSASFHGSAIKPASPAAEISMPDQNGNDFQLSALRGKVVLVFFGFLNCPYECPLTMAHLSQAVDMLGDRSQDVQVILVSTDPVRDTPQAMKDYLSKFNPSFLGITGTQDQLKTIWDAYGVVVLEGGETHSSYTYVIDQKGDLRLTFDPEMTSEDIAADLKILLDSQ